MAVAGGGPATGVAIYKIGGLLVSLLGTGGLCCWRIYHALDRRIRALEKSNSLEQRMAEAEKKIDNHQREMESIKQHMLTREEADRHFQAIKDAVDSLHEDMREIRRTHMGPGGHKET